MSQKEKWTTVSLPRDLATDITKLINKRRYWPGVSAFVREAALEKLRKEENLLSGKIIPKPILNFEPVLRSELGEKRK